MLGKVGVSLAPDVGNARLCLRALLVGYALAAIRQCGDFTLVTLVKQVS